MRERLSVIVQVSRRLRREPYHALAGQASEKRKARNRGSKGTRGDAGYCIRRCRGRPRQPGGRGAAQAVSAFGGPAAASPILCRRSSRQRPMLSSRWSSIPTTRRSLPQRCRFVEPQPGDLCRPVHGDATRQASVHAGLEALADSSRHPELVLIHDGARPFPSPSLIARAVAAGQRHGAAIPACR